MKEALTQIGSLLRATNLDARTQSDLLRAVGRMVQKLATDDPAFYQALCRDSNEALRAVGIALPADINVVLARPNDRVLSIPFLHEDLGRMRRMDDDSDPGPDPDGDPQPKPYKNLLFTGHTQHYSGVIFQQGHKGDDTWTIDVPPGKSVGQVFLGGDNGIMNGARLDGQSVSNGKLTVVVHWWFNAYLTTTYVLRIRLANVKKDVVPYKTQAFGISTFSPMPEEHSFTGGHLSSVWDNPGF